MEKRLDKIDKNIEDITEILVSMKDYMETNIATKDELCALEKKVDTGFEGVNGKIEGLHRRMDAELEQKRLIEDRVSKIEVKIFPSLAK